MGKADELLKLAALKKDGILPDEEFEAEKKKILDSSNESEVKTNTNTVEDIEAEIRKRKQIKEKIRREQLLEEQRRRNSSSRAFFGAILIVVGINSLVLGVMSLSSCGVAPIFLIFSILLFFCGYKLLKKQSLTSPDVQGEGTNNNKQE